MSDPVRRRSSGARFLVDGHLTGDVVDAELGQPLADAARGGTPLGLPELEHQALPQLTASPLR